MVVNDKYQFIFVHVPKAAGTSITQALKRIPGNSSSVSKATKHETINEYLQRCDNRSALLRALRRDPRPYFRFGFVRHPWLRLASLYVYMTEQRPRAEIDSVGSFREFIFEIRKEESWVSGLHSMRQQVEYFQCPPGTLAMDFVGHYETLADDLNSLLGRLGMDFDIPHLNRSADVWRR
jgi:hypothetical protein